MAMGKLFQYIIIINVNKNALNIIMVQELNQKCLQINMSVIFVFKETETRKKQRTVKQNKRF